MNEGRLGQSEKTKFIRRQSTRIKIEIHEKPRKPALHWLVCIIKHCTTDHSFRG